MTIIYTNETISIETEESEVPWLKIFTQEPYKEMSHVPPEVRQEIYMLLHKIEKQMLIYYKPEKINICSFGNYLPKVHWHIMARFKEDSFFPESMWGEKQREGNLSLPSFEVFCENLITGLSGNHP